jgi:cell division protein FtsW
VGLSTLLGVQSLLIMSGILKLIPLTGVTLPYLSYGGSSLLASFVIVGLLLRLSAGRSET